jgi:hypothetical protein
LPFHTPAKPAIYDIETGNPRQPNRQFTTAKPAIHFEVRLCGQWVIGVTLILTLKENPEREP